MSSKKTLRLKINISILATFLVIAALFSVALAVFETQRRENALRQIELAMNDMLLQRAARLADEIFAEHLRAVKATLHDMLARDGVVAVSAYDFAGGLLESTRENAPETLNIEGLTTEEGAAPPPPRIGIEKLDNEDVFTFTALIRAYEEDIGYCVITYSLATLKKETQQIILLFAALLLTLLLLMSGMLNVLMSKLVVGPVSKLKNVMLGVKGAKRGDIQSMEETFSAMSADLAGALSSQDEIGDLARSFDTMLDELSGAYVSIQQAEQKYRSIFENAVEGIFQITPQGRFIDVNQAMGALFGYETPAMLLAEFSTSDAQWLADPEALPVFLARVRESGGVSGFEMEFVRRDGARFWGAISAREVSGDTDLYFEGTLTDFTERLEKERAQKEREAAEAAAEARREFLDNSGQGYLSFGHDMRIDREFSRECLAIFKTDDISGQEIHALLYPQEGKERAAFATNMQRILDETDPFRRNLYLSLVPGEFKIGASLVKAEYKLLDGARILLILTDISHERELEDAVSREKSRLAFIVSVVRNPREFMDVLEDFKGYLAENDGELALGDENAVNETFRRIHTYKGLFGLLDCIHLPQALHELESDLARVRDTEAEAQSISGTERIPALLEAADDDLRIIRDALGDSYLAAGGEVRLPREKKDALVTMARRIAGRRGEQLDEKTKALVLEIESLEHVDFKSLLSAYPKLVRQLAQRLEKEVEPMHIEGDFIGINPDVYTPFARSLVHVFRNALTHGLETPEEREMLDKETAGRITCRVRRREDAIEITISDDGQGIDVDLLAEKSDSAADDLETLLFTDGLSSSDEADDVSGRGVGLPAVKEELDRLGGTVHIETVIGAGASFCFRAPLRNNIIHEEPAQ